MTLPKRHNGNRAVPMLAVVAALLMAVVATSMTLTLLHVERPASGGLALLGDGVDEFSLRLATIQSGMQGIAGASGMLVAIAWSSMALSLVAVLAHAFRVVRSPGDAHAVLRRLLTWARFTPSQHHAWGTVRDAQSGHPVPLAQLTLIGADGRTIARTHADVVGRYGFGIPLASIAKTSVRLEVRKSGYYFPAQRTATSAAHHYHGGPLAVLAASQKTVDVAVDPQEGTESHPVIRHLFAHIGTRVTWWASVLTVPLAAAVSPSPLTFALLAGFAINVMGHCAGLAHFYHA